MKLSWRLTFAALLLLAAFRIMAGEPDTLAGDFRNPPDSARPHTFWYWIDGNITREGLTADLEAMKRAGIGGVELYDIGGEAAHQQNGQQD